MSVMFDYGFTGFCIGWVWIGSIFMAHNWKYWEGALTYIVLGNLGGMNWIVLAWTGCIRSMGLHLCIAICFRRITSFGVKAGSMEDTQALFGKPLSPHLG